MKTRCPPILLAISLLAVAPAHAAEVPLPDLIVRLSFDDQFHGEDRAHTGNSGRIREQTAYADAAFAVFRSSGAKPVDLRSTTPGVGGTGYAFDNSRGAGTGLGLAGGAVAQNRLSGTALVPRCTAFTLTGWYWIEINPVGTGATLTANSRADTLKLSFEGAAGLRLTLRNDVDVVVVAESDTGSYNVSGAWVFYAVTVNFANRAQDKITFYQGGDAPAATARVVGVCDVVGNALTKILSGSQLIGNTADYNSTFGGLIDDYRIYQGELSAEQIESVRREVLPPSAP